MDYSDPVARRHYRKQLRLSDPRIAERERALKDSYRGSCEVCGKPTTGCFGPGSTPGRGMGALGGDSLIAFGDAGAPSS